MSETEAFLLLVAVLALAFKAGWELRSKYTERSEEAQP